jgi:hypothetical protein
MNWLRRHFSVRVYGLSRGWRVGHIEVAAFTVSWLALPLVTAPWFQVSLQGLGHGVTVTYWPEGKGE